MALGGQPQAPAALSIMIQPPPHLLLLRALEPVYTLRRSANPLRSLAQIPVFQIVGNL
jgi:hypothetical protein